MREIISLTEAWAKGQPNRAIRVSGTVDGLEEGKAHDVIPVGMGEDHRIVVAFLGDKAVSQPPDARTGVDDDDVVIPGADFDAGGVAAVAQILLARNRNGSPRPPAADQHAFPSPWSLLFAYARRKSFSLKMRMQASTTAGS